MTQEKLIDAITDLDSDILNRYFDMKADLAAKKKPKKRTWVKWASLAACLCLVVGVAFRIAIGFVPNQATDVFREGNLIEISNESELPAQYEGKLLAFNLGFEQYEFYYKTDGKAENTDDWYSLLASKRDINGYILLHCMFGETTVDDWKVSKVFTKDATETIAVNGVDVQIAKNEPSLDYEYWYYAIFEYDDVVYDLRVKSNDANYVFDVLNTILSSEK